MDSYRTNLVPPNSTKRHSLQLQVLGRALKFRIATGGKLEESKKRGKKSKNNRTRNATSHRVISGVQRDDWTSCAQLQFAFICQSVAGAEQKSLGSANPFSYFIRAAVEKALCSFLCVCIYIYMELPWGTLRYKMIAASNSRRRRREDGVVVGLRDVGLGIVGEWMMGRSKRGLFLWIKSAGRDEIYRSAYSYNGNNGECSLYSVFFLIILLYCIWYNSIFYELRFQRWWW